ncbi:MAG: phytoene desaturase family protein [Actinomycetota bacterium]
MAQIVVIGAGVGGLAAAIRLRASGHKVHIFEQAGHVGGKLGRYEREGFIFDTGPSLLTLPAVYRDLFLKTGAPLEECVELHSVDPVFRYRFTDGVDVDIPNASRAGVTFALDDAFGNGAGAQWSALMERAGRIWDITRKPFLESAIDGPRTLGRLALQFNDLATVAPWQSLRTLGTRYLDDPRLRFLLDRYATYAGSDPRHAPAALVTIPYVEQTFGAWWISGGLYGLAEAMKRRAIDMGVTIHCGATVERIVTHHGRVSGAVINGTQTAADIVVSNADASHLYQDLLSGPSARAALRKTKRATPSLSGFVLLLALRGRTPNLQHHTVLFPANYDDEFDSVFGTGRQRGKPRPAPDPTVYISAPNDAALRPDDNHEAWFVLVNAPRHVPSDRSAGIDWHDPGLADSYANRIIDVMAERGMDIRDRLLWREVRTPATLEQETRSVGGSIYGTSSNGPRAAFLRPANRGVIPGLFLVGGSAHPGGGLPLVGLSAEIVSRQIGHL